jgi:predicted nucleic acid-binding Zn ribbon protein
MMTCCFRHFATCAWLECQAHRCSYPDVHVECTWCKAYVRCKRSWLFDNSCKLSLPVAFLTSSFGHFVCHFSLDFRSLFSCSQCPHRRDASTCCHEVGHVFFSQQRRRQQRRRFRCYVLLVLVVVVGHFEHLTFDLRSLHCRTQIRQRHPPMQTIDHPMTSCTCFSQQTFTFRRFETFRQRKKNRKPKRSFFLFFFFFAPSSSKRRKLVFSFANERTMPRVVTQSQPFSLLLKNKGTRNKMYTASFYSVK